MLNLAEYKKKRDRVSDFLPWAALVAPGVVLNKDGSFQQTFSFRGPDLDSATQRELVSLHARVNNILKRLDSGWCLYAEAQRVYSQRYPQSKFPDPISLLTDEERKQFYQSGAHFESLYSLTLVWLTPQESEDKASKALIQRPGSKQEGGYELHLKHFRTEILRIFQLFQEILPEARLLSDDDTLTYLHSTVSTKRHFVKAPEIPMYLDALLADSPLLGGFEPRLGKAHLRTVTITGFPGSSTPGILDNLNRLNFEYRWSSRFIFLDKQEAQKELNEFRRKWFANRKSIVTVIRETITQSESVLNNSDALVKSDDVDIALQALGADHVSFGYYTATITIMDLDKNKLDKKLRAIEKTINSLGFDTITESMNAVEAWMGSLPGLVRANVRRPILSTLNLSHLLPLSAVWAGQETNHLGDPLIYCQTAGSTPFRLNLHVGDVGHTLVVGPTGSGKSILLALLAAQFRRYANSKVYFFDKDASSRILTAAVGGQFYDLAAEGSQLSFQPLAQIDNEKDRAWAAEWLYGLLENEKHTVTPDTKKVVWTALCSLASAPPAERTLSGLVQSIQDFSLRQTLQPFTLVGPFGKLFDSNQDLLINGNWQAFEMGALLNTPSVVAPTLSYLFHRIEERFNGSPTLLILDEAWLFLDSPMFAAKIREWLKTLRKFNVSVVFATQQLSDIANSSIAPAILDSCPTKIFLPNPNALEERTAKFYQDFGLNHRETETLALAQPKRQYYYKSSLGSRLFELTLGPLALAYCGASGKEDQTFCHGIQAENSSAEYFNYRWLRYKNLSDYENLYGTLIDPTKRTRDKYPNKQPGGSLHAIQQW